ncbi:MAG: 2-oxoacid:acceptor oxidoreductase family protein [Lachnospiraceae bacterium]|nr:2-oxoacid:acceptor oxidoreductase family protein [Lachnospiraceae bacterium]
MSKNIILCGVGGQGTILASKMIAAAAMNQGIHVRTAETIGMAQRGGSVFSHVRLGEDAASPLIRHEEADLIIGFEPGETVRLLPFLKKDGAVVSSTRPLMPVSAMIGQSEYDSEAMVTYLKDNVKNLTLVDSDQALQEIGNAKAMNVLLLGAAVESGQLGLSYDNIRQALHQKLPEKLWDVNERALTYLAK